MGTSLSAGTLQVTYHPNQHFHWLLLLELPWSTVKNATPEELPWFNMVGHHHLRGSSGWPANVGFVNKALFSKMHKISQYLQHCNKSLTQMFFFYLIFTPTSWPLKINRTSKDYKKWCLAWAWCFRACFNAMFLHNIPILSMSARYNLILMYYSSEKCNINLQGPALLHTYIATQSFWVY